MYTNIIQVRNFPHVGKESFIQLYKSMVQNHLEFSNSVWSPCKIGVIEALEKVQKRATKMVPSCNRLSYSNRLRYLNIPTLRYRRYGGDNPHNMIETYKTLHGIYNATVSPCLPHCQFFATRRNTFKLVKHYCRYDIRKYSFTERAINFWNGLPLCVVNSVCLS